MRQWWMVAPPAGTGQATAEEGSTSSTSRPWILGSRPMVWWGRTSPSVAAGYELHAAVFHGRVLQGEPDAETVVLQLLIPVRLVLVPRGGPADPGRLDDGVLSLELRILPEQAPADRRGVGAEQGVPQRFVVIDGVDDLGQAGGPVLLVGAGEIVLVPLLPARPLGEQPVADGAQLCNLPRGRDRLDHEVAVLAEESGLVFADCDRRGGHGRFLAASAPPRAGVGFISALGLRGRVRPGAVRFHGCVFCLRPRRFFVLRAGGPSTR